MKTNKEIVRINLTPSQKVQIKEHTGKDAESLAADIVRERKDLSWKKYAERVETYIRHLDALMRDLLF